MPQKLWEADSQTKTKSNLFEFEKFLAKKFNYEAKKNYKKLFDWTIKHPKSFWTVIISTIESELATCADFALNECINIFFLTFLLIFFVTIILLVFYYKIRY